MLMRLPRGSPNDVVTQKVVENLEGKKISSRLCLLVGDHRLACVRAGSHVVCCCSLACFRSVLRTRRILSSVCCRESSNTQNAGNAT